MMSKMRREMGYSNQIFLKKEKYLEDNKHIVIIHSNIKIIISLYASRE